MNLDQIATKCFILALFIRDDGQRLLLGDGYYDFNQKLQHFQANTIANDIVEIQGDNGQLLAGQVMRSGAQKFEGYIGDATTSRQIIEQKRSDFMAFFRIKHFYKVIYIFPDGTAIQRQRGYLTDAPTIPEIFQKFPEYSVALNFEDANYYEYAEDEHGDEIYAHIAELALAGETSGGLIWDAIGAVTNGITWSGIQTAQGEYIQITNDLSLQAPLASVEMLGNAEQDGTPTPDAPQPISVVTGENVVKIEGKNLAPTANDATATSTGVAYTIQDGAITIKGTSTRSPVAQAVSVLDGFASSANYPSYVIMSEQNSFSLPAGTYTISATVVNNGNISDGNTGIYVGVGTIGQRPTTTYPTVTPITPSRTFTVEDGQRVMLAVKYEGGSTAREIDTTISNIQIELGSQASDYQPYQGRNYAISLGDSYLAKIPNTDYRDKLVKVDGTWYIRRKVGKYAFTGSESVSVYSSGTYSFSITPDLTNIAHDSNSVLVLSDKLLGVSLASIYNNRNTGGVYYLSSFSSNRFAIIAGTTSTTTDIQTFLANNTPTVYYALATPTTTEITNEALIAQLDALGASSLYLGVNNIGTETQNAMPTLKIEYYTEYTLDGAGYEWEPGGNTSRTIVTVAGVDSAWPIWTIQGGAQNPTLTNITTGQTISWQGFVPEGQTLTINMAEMTADLAGANVFEYITGEWLRLAPGNNTLVYNAGSADKPSTLSWNGVLA